MMGLQHVPKITFAGVVFDTRIGPGRWTGISLGHQARAHTPQPIAVRGVAPRTALRARRAPHSVARTARPTEGHQASRTPERRPAIKVRGRPLWDGPKPTSGIATAVLTSIVTHRETRHTHTRAAHTPRATRHHPRGLHPYSRSSLLFPFSLFSLSLFSLSLLSSPSLSLSLLSSPSLSLSCLPLLSLLSLSLVFPLCLSLPPLPGANPIYDRMWV